MLRYYLFYKPFQVLSQFSPEGDKKTLADYFKNIEKDVYPVGRLDFDSEGLLLLTNDKKLSHQLLEPKFRHPRTYWVQVEGEITDEALEQLSTGVSFQLSGKPYRSLAAIAQRIEGSPELPERFPPIRYRKSVPSSWLSLTLKEGKNRQVRRMTAAVGFPTLRLLRYAIGAHTIAGMESGTIKDLAATEVPLFLQALKS